MRSGLILALIERLIEFSRRRAWLVTAIAIGVTTGCAFYAGDRLSIDTDVDKLLDQTLPWRQRELAFDREFPQFVNLTVVVIDGATPDQAEDAAAALTAKLETMPEVAREVSWTEGSEFFKRNGILLLSKEEVRGFADQMVAAQPMIGTLAADPSLRGLFEALTLAGEGVERGETGGSDLDRPFGAFADTVEASLRGSYRPISWQTLLTGREPGALDLRRFVLVRPVLDYDELKPGGRASAAIRQAARELGLTPERGVRVRLTGPVPLGDEEFASVTEGAGFSTGLAFGLICLLLFLALRSVRLVVPILITLAMGLVITAAFAALMVHALNLISVAFAVLFIGIAVDFGIQFSVRYRSERHDHDDFAEALRRTAHGIGAPLAIAALTTAVGFLSFVPTAYIGVSDLGLISGAGMVVALALNLTVLPALLVLIRPRGERRRVGFRRLAPVDRFLLRRRRAVSFVALGFAAVGIALAPDLAFDFNPIHLKDPRSESVTTLDDLMADPDTTPYTIDVLAASPEAARELAERLDRLPEVSHSLTVMTFVPADQQEKLAILQDVAMLLGPTLSPPSVRPAPDIGTEIEALQEAASVMARAAKASGRPSVKRMAAVLQQAVARGPETLPLLRANLTAGLATRLAEMRLALAAGPVSLQTLPADLKREWVAPDGRARIQVFPKGDASRNEVLRRFVAAVRAVVPDATGAPISIQESAETIVGAFRNAGIFALIAIAGLLSIVLRKIRDVLLVLAPLVLAGLLTVATSVLADLPLNFANIIALPLLLGVGVAFDIYFVMNWRAGIGEPLQSSTARAVLFSALTTASAFGSLALSRHPGTSQMGILLTIALGYTLLCTFLVLPSLMGPVRRRGRK
ncbi:MAG TPA: MMPL family transporter [Stellaceae bacterium]|nr:MMPL family transporter [Stellaceae bacterium]